jgi:hypothetical protein
MITGKKRHIAWMAAVLALVAMPALAGEYDTEGVELASYRTARRGVLTTSPRRVAVWHGNSPTLASANYRDDYRDEEPAEMPPSPGQSRRTAHWNRTEPETSTFLDESAGDYSGGCAAGCSDGCSEPCGGACGGFCGDICGDFCGPCDDLCGPPWWAHRSYFFGEYLYLRPTGIDMAHAIQQNGAGGSGTTPDGRVGVVDQAYTSAYAVGFGVALSPCASVDASYMDFYSHNTDSLAAPNVSGGTVGSLVLHPESVHEGSTSSLVNAFNDIDFRVADLMYRRLLRAGPRFALNYSVGARYGQLTQQFGQIGNFASPTGTVNTTTNVKFHGGGFRFGLDGMQRLGRTRFGVYGKSYLSLLFGQFRSNYLQFNETTTATEAASNWNDQRVVPVLDYEIGLNWTSCNGHWRFSAGYYTAFWFNIVSTPQWVQAVQNSDFVDLGETLAFDGLVSRLEFRF